MSSASASSSSSSGFAERSQRLYVPPPDSLLYRPIAEHTSIEELLEGDQSSIASAIKSRVEEVHVQAKKRVREEAEDEDESDGESGDEDGRRVRSRTTKAAQDGFGGAVAAPQQKYLSSIDPGAKNPGLEPFFGMPTRPQFLDPMSSFGYENRDLPMAYQGESVYNKMMILNELFEDDIWYVTKALPWMAHNSTSPIVLDRFIFDTAQLSRNPYRAPSRLITSRQDQKKAGIVRYGIMHELSYEFYKTEAGRMLWAGNQEQIKFAVQEMTCLAVIVELLGCWRPHDNLNASTGTPHTIANFRAILAEEVDNWDRVHCYQDALYTLADSMRKRINKRVRVPESKLVFILPDGAGRYADSVNITGNAPPGNGGGSAKTSLDPSTSRIHVRGVGHTYESRPFRMGAGMENDFYDPMFQERQFGWHYQMPGHTEDCNSAATIRNFLTRHLDIKVYQCERDDWANISYRDAFAANQMYDAETGGITAIGRCILSDAANWKWFSGDSDDQSAAKRNFKKQLFQEATRGARPASLLTVLGRSKFDLVKECLRERSMRPNPRFWASFDTHIRPLCPNDPAQMPGPNANMDLKQAEYVLNCMDLNRRTWWDFCLDQDIPTFIPHRIYVPNIRWMAGAAVMLEGDGGTGNTYVGNASYRRSVDATLGNYRAAFNIGVRALVREDRKVEIDATAFIADYVGGDNGKFWKSKEHREQLKKNRSNLAMCSMFSYAMPPTSECDSENYQDITGEFNRRFVDDQGKPHCDSAQFYTDWWGFHPSGVAISQAPLVQRARNQQGMGTITCQGMQWSWNCNKRDYVSVIVNHGPWTRFLDAGFQKLRRQRTAALPVCKALSQPNVTLAIV